MNDLWFLYHGVRRARAVLLDFLSGLPGEVLLETHPAFGWSSLHGTALHVADCYSFWIGAAGFGRAVLERDPHAYAGAGGLRRAFLEVDALLEEALNTWQDWDLEFMLERPGRRTLTLTRRWLIVHPITHEFHHKGQMLSLSRALGHPLPPELDTDFPPSSEW